MIKSNLGLKGLRKAEPSNTCCYSILPFSNEVEHIANIINGASLDSYGKIIYGITCEKNSEGVEKITIIHKTKGKEGFSEQESEAYFTNTLAAQFAESAGRFGITVNFYLPEIDKTIKYTPDNSAYVKKEKIYTEGIITNITKDGNKNEIKGEIGIVDSVEELFSPNLQEKIEKFVVKNSKNHLLFYCHLGKKYHEELQERLEEAGISFHALLSIINLYFINACVKYGVLFTLYYKGKDNNFYPVDLAYSLGIIYGENKEIQSADDYPNFGIIKK